jgi:hypothetical protein
LKEISKHRFDLENEIRSIDGELGRESNENYNSKMHIIKDKEFEDLTNKRFGLEVHLQDELIKAKDEEIKKFQNDRQGVKA